MPLPPPDPRHGAHHRNIDMKTFARDDGGFDVEGHLVDTKPFPFERMGTPEPIRPGQPLHDLWIRLTVDADYSVRDVVAASDTTPYSICREAEQTLKVLVGQRIARGWSSLVKEKLRGAAGCTHLTEMLIPMATTALQGINGLKSKDERRNPGKKAAQIDGCYAYGSSRAVVKMLWPEHYRP